MPGRDTLVQWLKDLIWPERVFCLACGLASRGGYLCPECQRELDETQTNMAKRPDDDLFLRSVWPHAGVARSLVLQLKFYNVEAAAGLLAPAMARVAGQMDIPPDAVITWVPMPPKRRRARGIDHGQCLARAVGRELGLPVQPLMRRVKESRQQLSLGAEERKRNLKDTFTALEEIRRPVLIVDDVCTTGSTVNACTEALLAAGALWVKALTATHARSYQEVAYEDHDDEWKAADHF